MRFIASILLISSTHLFATDEWKDVDDVPATIEMVIKVAMQIPESVRNKIGSIKSFREGPSTDAKMYTVKSSYAVDSMHGGTMELTIIERIRRVGRHEEKYYSVTWQDHGPVRDDMGWQPYQEFSEEPTEVTDARRMVEVMMHASPLLDDATRDLVKTVHAVSAYTNNASTHFYILAKYPAGDFWTGDIEIDIEETARRVGLHLINFYTVTSRHLEDI